jgi:hypothetical protein
MNIKNKEIIYQQKKLNKLMNDLDNGKYDKFENLGSLLVFFKYKDNKIIRKNCINISLLKE